MNDVKMSGLALAHALTTQTPTILRAIQQQVMINQSIAIRELTIKRTTAKPALDTKLSKARVLFNTNDALTRTEMISLFVDQLGLTSAGATTYYSKLKGDPTRTK